MSGICALLTPPPHTHTHTHISIRTRAQYAQGPALMEAVPCGATIERNQGPLVGELCLGDFFPLHVIQY
jgi:hypothetical protein